MTDNPTSDLDPDEDRSQRRVVAWSVPRKDIDHRPIVEVLLMIAKDLGLEESAAPSREEEN